MKVKLRNLTPEQYEKWEHNCCNNTMTCIACPFEYVSCISNSDGCWVRNKDLYSDKFLDQELEIEQRLLDDIEKQYLESVLRPFKNKRLEIFKLYYVCGSKERIFITFFNDKEGDTTTIFFPPFKEGTMYKGLEHNKHYTAEELGLFEKEVIK